jgi:D-glycero-D-manno-heptose 1,7-bisphosphate phosphatase
VRILPNVTEALRVFADSGYACIVVTNQSGVARGYFDIPAMHAVNAEVSRRLSDDGAALDAFYACTHYDDGCECRKPAPGLIRQAASEHEIDVARSAVVGDRGSDIALAHGVGIPGVLVPGPLAYDGPEPDFRANDLLEAARWIVGRGR